MNILCIYYEVQILYSVYVHNLIKNICICMQSIYTNMYKDIYVYTQRYTYKHIYTTFCKEENIFINYLRYQSVKLN